MSRGGGYTRIIQAIRNGFEQQGIPNALAQRILDRHLVETGQQNPSTLAALGAIFDDRSIECHSAKLPSSAVRAIANSTQDVLSTHFPRTAWREVEPASVRLWRRVSTCAIFLLLALNIYLILGLLLEGKSALISSRLLAPALFLALLLLLGMVEALHISVAELHLKDLAGVREASPRAYALHKLFRTEDGFDKFIAGRQFFVVTIVFVVAQLTTFKDANQFPFTSVSIPGILSITLLRFGMAGALLILWFAQLLPQFTAARRPVQFMNARPIGWLYRLALVVERIGITWPGTWFTWWVQREPRIPSSPHEQFVQESLDRNLGVTVLSKTWHLGPADGELDYFVAATIVGDNARQFLDKSIVADLDNPQIKSMSITYRPPDESMPSGVVPKTEFLSQYLNLHRWEISGAPSHNGTFYPGSIITSEFKATGKTRGATATVEGTRVKQFRDIITINVPTRRLVYRATIEGATFTRPARATFLMPHEWQNSQPADDLPSKYYPFVQVGSLLQVDIPIDFPPTGSVIEITWWYRN